MAKRKKKSNCDDCVWYNLSDANSKVLVYTCGAEHKMTFNEFEDYFVDKVMSCPYYEKNTEENNGD